MSSTASVETQVASETVAKRVWSGTRRFRPVLVLLIVLYIYMAVTQTGFFTTSNMENLATSVSVLWVASLGMTFVVLSGGFDLSIGAVGALAAYFMGKVLEAGMPPGAAIALGIVSGGLVGAAINGMLIGVLRLSFFVVTLASMTALTGVVNLWSNTQTITLTSPTIVNIGVGHFVGIPIAVWIMVGTLVLLLFLQHRSYFGRDVLAVGGNFDAARLSGIRTERTILAVYAISGALAALGGIIIAARIGGASPEVDNNLPLQAAAAVLIGGTTLTGGAGGLGGTAIGVMFIGVLQNGLSIAGVQSFWQQVITGVILVSAVLFDTLQSRNRQRWSRRFGRGAHKLGKSPKILTPDQEGPS